MTIPADYNSQTDTVLSAVRLELQASIKRIETFCSPTVFLGGPVALASFALALAIIPGGHGLMAAMGILLSSFPFMAIALHHHEETLPFKRERLALLTPLSETLHCSEMLSYVQNSPPARKLYDEIIAQGRQLYMFDFEAIKSALAQQEQEKEAQRHAAYVQENAEACRKLHGITT